jgi:hypothetical protein
MTTPNTSSGLDAKQATADRMIYLHVIFTSADIAAGRIATNEVYSFPLFTVGTPVYVRRLHPQLVW